MEIHEQFNEIDFLQVAQQLNANEGADVYFYAMNNKDINITKTVVNDFETWVMIYNHYNNDITLVVTGATPIYNVERYTLVTHLENVVKPDPLVAEIEETPPTVNLE
jgi:hypothetical protein